MQKRIFGNRILDYQDDIINDLREFIKIKSIAKLEGENAEAPYGEGALEALKWILNKAEEMGFKTKMIENKAGHAEYGEGEDIFAVATHVDVLPTSEDWDTDPFELVEKDGVLYGRGVVDNKGPAIITLYAMKVLKEEGILGNYKLRALFGSGEEISANDLKTYFAYEKKPIISFVPDAEYGICTAEKGLIWVRITGEGLKNSIVKQIKGGEVINSVPKRTEAVIKCTEEEYKNLIEVSKQIDGKFYFKYNENELNIECIGKTIRASLPEIGVNSILCMVELLVRGFGVEKLGNFIEFINKKIGTGYNGEKIGLKIEDRQSGKLTMCVSFINIDSNHSEISMDIRYPVTSGREYVFNKINKGSEEFGLKAEVTENLGLPPFYFSKDSKLVVQLKEAYKNITEEEAKIYSMGGGTYARELYNTGVAFGPMFNNNKMYQGNERIDIKELMLHAQICLEAMYKIFTEK